MNLHADIGVLRRVSQIIGKEALRCRVEVAEPFGHRVLGAHSHLRRELDANDGRRDLAEERFGFFIQLVKQWPAGGQIGGKRAWESCGRIIVGAGEDRRGEEGRGEQRQ